ncbi:hypothetical protein D3C81_1360530 [compost metagenome]
MKSSRAACAYAACCTCKSIDPFHIRWKAKFTIRVESHCNYTTSEVRLFRYFAAITVNIYTFSFFRYEHLVLNRIINNSDDNLTTISECYRYAKKWEAMYKIRCTIDWIDDP